MKVETWLFGSGVFLFVPISLVYGRLTHYEELVGFLGIFLVGLFSAMVGGYFWLTARKIDVRPEDNPVAQVHEGSGEQGFFSPWSWWPIFVAASAATLFLGLAVGWWVFIIGIFFASIALIGWVYEYYRGDHSH